MISYSISPGTIPGKSEKIPAGSGEEILRRIRIWGQNLRIQPSRGQNLGKTYLENFKNFPGIPGSYLISPGKIPGKSEPLAAATVCHPEVHAPPWQLLQA